MWRKWPCPARTISWRATQAERPRASSCCSGWTTRTSALTSAVSRWRGRAKASGAALLGAALAHVFGATPTHRLQLLVYAENARARHAYARAGLVEEGLLRDIRRLPDGRFRSMLMMSILRPEWAAKIFTQPNRSLP